MRQPLLPNRQVLLGDRRLPAAALTAAGLAGAAALSLVVVQLAYMTSPLTAVGLVAGAGTVILALVAPVLAVIPAVLAIPMEPLELQIGEAGLSPAEIAFILVGACGGIRLVGSRLSRPSAAHISFAVLLVVLAVGLFTAVDRGVVAKPLVLWTALLVVSMIVARARRFEVELILVAIAIAGACVGVVAIATTGNQELLNQGATATNRAEASFEHPNVLGSFLVLALPAAIVLVGARGSLRFLRPVMLVGAVLIGFGLLLTLSRAAILGGVVALLVLVAWQPFRRVALGALAVAAVVVAFNAEAVFGSPQFAVIGERIATVTDPTSTWGARSSLWETTPTIIGDHPLFGVGINNFSLVAPEYGLFNLNGAIFEHAHNLLLSFAVELGLVGALVFLWWVVAVARTTLRAVRRSESTRSMALACAAALAGIAAVGMLHEPLGTNVIMAIVLVYVGVAVAIASPVRDDTGARAGP